jgi:predicted transcriptional regulator of viral defense system
MESSKILLFDWVKKQKRRGKHAFSLDFLEKELPNYSKIAEKSALRRLSEKGEIISIYRSYYLILSDQYALKGMLPPTVFLDSFMQFLNRPYYLGLLNAATFHGASHQQPQEFFVMIQSPAMRPTNRKGIKLNYINKKEWPAELLETRKTESGFIKISNPVLTAIDLIEYEKRIGGINRVATILEELADSILTNDFTEKLIENTTLAVLQRLGYLLEILEKNELADALFLRLATKKLARIPLKVSFNKKGFPINERWKVIINTVIEIDE